MALTNDKVTAFVTRRRYEREVAACLHEAYAMNAQHDLAARDRAGFAPKRSPFARALPGDITPDPAWVPLRDRKRGAR